MLRRVSLRKDRATCDLKLDRSCIFIPHGSNTEAHHATGKLTINLSQTTHLKSIQVRLRGLLKIPRDGFLMSEDARQITYVRDQHLAWSTKLSSFAVDAGTYEFLFNIPLEGALLETITGPKHQYHTYQVEAIVERKYMSDLHMAQPLRVYKFSPELECHYLTSFENQCIEGHSPQNISYRIALPTITIPFASSFPVQCTFLAPSKDITLTTLTLSITEKHFLQIAATAAQSARHNIHTIRSTRKHVIVTQKHVFTRDNQPPGFEFTDGFTDEWFVSEMLQLPDDLGLCSQSISTKTVKISHVLGVKADFRDSDGNFFEIVETLPLHLYMTPRAIGPDASVHGRVVLDHGEPPPAYGDHLSHLRLFDGEVGRAVEGLACNLGMLGSESRYEGSSYARPPEFTSTVVT